MRVADAVTLFVTRWTAERGLTARTAAAYRADLAQFAQGSGVDRLGDLPADAADRFASALSSAGFADNSVRRKLAALKVFFEFCAKQGLVAAAPAVDGRRGGVRPSPPVLTGEEVSRLLAVPAALADARRRAFDAAPDDALRRGAYAVAVRDRAILELLFATGMRIGELTALNSGDLDPKQGTITVRGRGERRRVLELPTREIARLLKQWMELRRAPSADAPLFLNRKGERLSIHSLENVFRKYARAAGLGAHVTPHVLRHTLAARLLMHGVDLHGVRELLGHASLSTTQMYRVFAPVEDGAPVRTARVPAVPASLPHPAATHAANVAAAAVLRP